MGVTEIMHQIERLSIEDQQEIFVRLTKKVLSSGGRAPKAWLVNQVSFDEACDVVFRENRELLVALAQPSTAVSDEFKRAADQMFSTNAELFHKLAQ